MNAQEDWKSIWRVRNDWREPRFWMKKVRREAALERIIARLQRENAALRHAENKPFYHPAFDEGDGVYRP